MAENFSRALAEYESKMANPFEYFYEEEDDDESYGEPDYCKEYIEKEMM